MSDGDISLDKLPEYIDSLKATITQQAQELERLTMLVKNRREEVEKLVLEATHTYEVVIPDLKQQLAAMTIELEECKHQNGISARESELEQQLAASQSRCAKFEAIVRDHQDGACNRTIAQLQATLAAREAEIDRLKLAQQHSIQDECEAEQHLIDAGISDYEPGGDGEYRGLLTQIDLCIKQRDAAVQEAGRLRSVLKKIAKPALGGKQQQWMAQEALKGA